MEDWNWIRQTHHHQNSLSDRGNGAGAIATLRTAGLNLLRLAGYQSIAAGMQAVMQDITTVLAMSRQPQPNRC